MPGSDGSSRSVPGRGRRHRVHHTPVHRPVVVGRLAQVWRYPVKSMLGEPLETAGLTSAGVAGDRCLALLHRDTGRVASAKDPRRWRGLLTLRASGGTPETVRIDLPDGRRLRPADPDADAVLSRLLDQPVTLVDTAPPGAVLDRARPDEVLAAGVAAPVTVDVSPLATAAAAGTFFDFAPVHLVTTSTMDAIGAATPGGVEVCRYRPNLVLATSGTGFVENDWVGRDVHLGPEVVLRVLARTPRCAVPTLAHGTLPRAVEALRVPARLNRVAPLPELAAQPCVGAYAQVVRAGRVSIGDRAEVR
ncbi:MOSC domain-containing protein [Micromonospora fluostatini]|uniref:MOSC domain-containing protein n=1 Tax=Micromonospora sp. JCM 30529 TaxID=3421643 RepID=UPI003D173C71